MFTDSKSTAIVAAFICNKANYAATGSSVSDEIVAALQSFGYRFDGYTDKGVPRVAKGSATVGVSAFVPALWAQCQIDPGLRSRVYGVHIVDAAGTRLPVGPMIDRRVTGQAARFVPVGVE